MGWLRIRDTEVSVLDILELISQGKCIDNILVRFPCLAPTDIAGAAATARSIIVQHWTRCRSPEAVMRRNFIAGPGTRKTEIWTGEEDEELVKLVSSGASLDDVARILLRIRADITRRLETLNKT